MHNGNENDGSLHQYGFRLVERHLALEADVTQANGPVRFVITAVYL
jgi:hypothetical protein